MRFPRFACILTLLCVGVAGPARCIVLFGGMSPERNAATPGDNSGWQYEGTFDGYLATPISPHFFLTAAHLGGGIGDTITYHGQTFTTVAHYDDYPTTDLRLWKIDGTFPTFAPLYRGGDELGKEMRVFGRGGPRGGEILLGASLKGWAWTYGGYLQRWGTNHVAALPEKGQYLQATFDAAGGEDECHLSEHDSGGGVFIQDDGLWKLAAINYAVDDLYRKDGNAYTMFVGAVFDARGFYTKENNVYSPVPDTGVDQPTSFYSTRVSSRIDWILEHLETDDISALPGESYATWLPLYYSPGEIATAATAPEADPDQDGVTNLLEFAFNLDPTFAEIPTLVPGAGVRGLPSIQLNDQSLLTVEYIRRTTASAPGITYAAQFADGLAPGDWQTSAAETVTPINPRWERVVATDPAPPGGGARFARVRVEPAPPRRGQTGPPHGITPAERDSHLSGAFE